MFVSFYRALTLLAAITLPTPPSSLSVTPSLPPFHSLSTCPLLILQNTRSPVFHLPPPVNSSPSPYSSPLLAPITPLLPLFSRLPVPVAPYSGSVAQVETPTTSRAKELLDMYRALSAPITNAADTDNRLEVLLRVKVGTKTSRHLDTQTLCDRRIDKLTDRHDRHNDTQTQTLYDRQTDRQTLSPVL